MPNYKEICSVISQRKQAGGQLRPTYSAFILVLIQTDGTAGSVVLIKLQKPNVTTQSKRSRTEQQRQV
jgi:hypothetical protein